MSAGQTGFFGKLPTAGDFVTRGLSADARRSIDRWLTSRFGADAAPPEAGRIALLPLGTQIITLAVLDSADRLGRHFPLAAACVTPGAPAPATADAWAAGALPHLRAATQGTLAAGELLRTLGTLAPPEPAQAPPPLPLDWPFGHSPKG